MNEEAKSVIVISASSDIGLALTQRWTARGWQVAGTYRTASPQLNQLREIDVPLVQCDLDDVDSIRKACAELREACRAWDVLAMCPGAQEPIGLFNECNYDEWENSIKINFTSPMRIIHELLPARRLGTALGPCVLQFAGGGTNSAPPYYSAYIAAKIALVKMTEILDVEVPDTRFCIEGPGWVKTKIHNATLKAGPQWAGYNYQLTIDKLAGDECAPIADVLDHCDWLINLPRDIVSGRNFSLRHDRWRSKELETSLAKDPNMYKLRRSGNDKLVKNNKS